MTQEPLMSTEDKARIIDWFAVCFILSMGLLWIAIIAGVAWRIFSVLGGV